MPAPAQPGAATRAGGDSSATWPGGYYYIFHGDDELAVVEELAKLRRKLGKGDPAMAELNTSVLDGRQLSFGELRHICDAIPFMNDRRLVIVRGLLARLVPERKMRGEEAAREEESGWRRAYIKDLTGYLPSLPPTTRLVFIEDRLLEESHPVLKFAMAQGKERGAHVMGHKAPYESDLAGWIARRVRSRNGSISTEATDLLGALIGRDLRSLDSEIEKLLLYVGDRQVTTADVKALVSEARELVIWDLVDSVGDRQANRALRLLHGLLLQDKEPLQVLGTLAWHVRTLIRVGELQSRGLAGDALAKSADLHPFTARKAVAQLTHFTVAQLESAHQAIVETDWAIKTGEMDDTLALDLLVVRLCGESAP